MARWSPIRAERVANTCRTWCRYVERWSAIRSEVVREEFSSDSVRCAYQLFFYFFYFCPAIWQKMNEEDQKIWAVLEVRLRDMMTLCDERKQTIESLTQIIRRMEADYRTLNAKYTDLLAAGYIVSADEDERKAAKKRLSDLVREVDKCLALLNG